MLANDLFAASQQICKSFGLTQLPFGAFNQITLLHSYAQQSIYTSNYILSNFYLFVALNSIWEFRNVLVQGQPGTCGKSCSPFYRNEHLTESKMVSFANFLLIQRGIAANHSHRHRRTEQDSIGMPKKLVATNFQWFLFRLRLLTFPRAS